MLFGFRHIQFMAELKYSCEEMVRGSQNKTDKKDALRLLYRAAFLKRTSSRSELLSVGAIQSTYSIFRLSKLFSHFRLCFSIAYYEKSNMKNIPGYQYGSISFRQMICMKKIFLTAAIYLEECRLRCLVAFVSMKLPLNFICSVTLWYYIPCHKQVVHEHYMFAKMIETFFVQNVIQSYFAKMLQIERKSWQMFLIIGKSV